MLRLLISPFPNSPGHNSSLVLFLYEKYYVVECMHAYITFCLPKYRCGTHSRNGLSGAEGKCTCHSSSSLCNTLLQLSCPGTAAYGLPSLVCVYWSMLLMQDFLCFVYVPQCGCGGHWTTVGAIPCLLPLSDKSLFISCCVH